MSNVDSEKIRSTAKSLDGIVQSVEAQVRKFNEAISNLDRGWKSGVKADFMARYAKDKDAMQEMIEQLREVNAQLLEMANDFDKTESDTMQRIASLRR